MFNDIVTGVICLAILYMVGTVVYKGIYNLIVCLIAKWVVSRENSINLFFKMNGFEELEIKSVSPLTVPTHSCISVMLLGKIVPTIGPIELFVWLLRLKYSNDKNKTILSFKDTLNYYMNRQISNESKIHKKGNKPF